MSTEWVCCANQQKSQKTLESREPQCLECREEGKYTHTHTHTHIQLTVSMINTLYIAAHLQFWIINVALWGWHTNINTSKHTYTPTVKGVCVWRSGWVGGVCVCVCVCVCGGGDNKSKAPQWGRQMAARLLARWRQRQTPLDSSLALSSVFLEFTDKKHAGGRHH